MFSIQHNAGSIHKKGFDRNVHGKRLMLTIQVPFSIRSFASFKIHEQWQLLISMRSAKWPGWLLQY
jgi:hypothetical protein